MQLLCICSSIYLNKTKLSLAFSNCSQQQLGSLTVHVPIKVITKHRAWLLLETMTRSNEAIAISSRACLMRADQGWCREQSEDYGRDVCVSAGKGQLSISTSSPIPITPFGCDPPPSQVHSESHQLVQVQLDPSEQLTLAPHQRIVAILWSPQDVLQWHSAKHAQL